MSTVPHEECWLGAYLPYLGLEPAGGYKPFKSVTHVTVNAQCKKRFTSSTLFISMLEYNKGSAVAEMGDRRATITHNILTKLLS